MHAENECVADQVYSGSAGVLALPEEGALLQAHTQGRPGAWLLDGSG